MKIGIIGAGEIGGTLVRQYSKAGHRVKVANASGPEKLKHLALETGASPVRLVDVVNDVDVVVVSIPLIGIPDLSPQLFQNLPTDVVIIDTCNYYPIRDGLIKDLEDGMPESIWVSNQLERPVVKAYNNILYRSLVHSGHTKGSPSRLALPIAGDNKRSKELVSILIDNSGFDSFDYGSLQESWRQQPGSPVYCTDLTLAQLKKSIKKAKKELLPERRQLGLQYILKHDPELWMENVRYNRKIYESD